MIIQSTAMDRLDSTMDQTAEVSIRGYWVRVPAINIGTNKLVVVGNRIKIASVFGEEYLGKELGDPQTCIVELKARRSTGPRVDILTFTQRIPDTKPKFTYPLEWDSIAVVRTDNFKGWWDGLPQETRKNTRRAEKRGVTVKVRTLDDNLVKGIIGVNNDSPLRQNKRFVHYGKGFDEVLKDQSSYLDRSDFICAYLGDELIGFLKVAYNERIASIVQMLPMASHQDKRPANALLAKAVEICESKGMQYMTYGKFNYGNKSESSLLEFKIRNGFEELLMPRYYVPITLRGSMYLKLQLHRGLLGILPAHWIAVGLRVRTSWRKLKQSIKPV